MSGAGLCPEAWGLRVGEIEVQLQRRGDQNNKCSLILDGSFLLTEQAEQDSTPKPRCVFLVRITRKQHGQRDVRASRRHWGCKEGGVLTAVGTQGGS